MVAKQVRKVNVLIYEVRPSWISFKGTTKSLIWTSKANSLPSWIGQIGRNVLLALEIRVKAVQLLVMSTLLKTQRLATFSRVS